MSSPSGIEHETGAGAHKEVHHHARAARAALYCIYGALCWWWCTLVDILYSCTLWNIPYVTWCARFMSLLSYMTYTVYGNFVLSFVRRILSDIQLVAYVYIIQHVESMKHV